MDEMLKQVEAFKVVPVVVIENVEDAIPLAQALVNGGLPVAEVTFRTAAAPDAIKAMSEKFPELCVGAGTVINVEQCKKAVECGAKFIVSPGYSEEVTQYCIENEIPIFPGICTPTELINVVNHGLPVAKFFPAAQFGGLKTINALGSVFPQMKFMPTGGVSESNVLEYLASPKIIAAGGSWMVKGDLIKAGKFDEIEAMTKSVVELVKNA
ncbi:MAG: bifunctional 4-hydroxy-2-oxoglutarate aldolase/2-dehydro-3-deoxy-phosphogluconate aldolase [Lachnospiraceae bacterium]|jgi:2-dehydro-3-deoxyphosphogluconate aldolase/(4S)-4-hydroxy-2-oxoglutarate aldolase|nr:bifunctional 4-hydroxy-2-oxoglutarate aldolase/2-dehydro-3-deoxy-phosphogluconate aldolase [Lachnospiraceae bacterium]MBQ1604514.1 bifunctional 4-hydroxy-2-oxoglutarate aldolase/2-dehydro-3-deoxy-phosphogluconate aldolase [Lachnospiraceae bacterium]MBQ4301430.1 bifunctional 4-hydroxy-2-oxoglutarate aldolase/2-dehydro-3-deoxy-phosphogluconate aldolase [Lachnospiraceae bacterium]